MKSGVTSIRTRIRCTSRSVLHPRLRGQGACGAKIRGYRTALPIALKGFCDCHDARGRSDRLMPQVPLCWGEVIRGSEVWLARDGSEAATSY